jgi:hypothetical protein
MFLICFILFIVTIKRKNVFQRFKPYFLLFGIFMFFFLFISSVNFFTNRYVISLVFLFAIITAYTIHAAVKKELIAWLLVSIILISGVVNCIIQRTNCDHNLGYIDASRTEMEKAQKKP